MITLKEIISGMPKSFWYNMSYDKKCIAIKMDIYGDEAFNVLKLISSEIQKLSSDSTESFFLLKESLNCKTSFNSNFGCYVIFWPDIEFT